MFFLPTSLPVNTATEGGCVFQPLPASGMLRGVLATVFGQAAPRHVFVHLETVQCSAVKQQLLTSSGHYFQSNG